MVTEAQRGLPLILTRKVGKVTPKTLRKKQKSQFFSFHYFLFSHTPAPKQSCASSRRGRNGSPQEPKIWGRAPPLYLVELWFQENGVNTGGLFSLSLFSCHLALDADTIIAVHSRTGCWITKAPASWMDYWKMELEGNGKYWRDRTEEVWDSNPIYFFMNHWTHACIELILINILNNLRADLISRPLFRSRSGYYVAHRWNWSE